MIFIENNFKKNYTQVDWFLLFLRTIIYLLNRHIIHGVDILIIDLRLKYLIEK